MEKDSVLEMRHIYKTFPGVKALEGVDLTLKKGEIRALMGENGAGKSTLIKCLTGVNKFEAGEIYLEGFDHPIVNKDTMDAQKKGISTVYQEVNLCPNLSVGAADKAWNGQPKGNEPSGSCPYETAGA